MVRLGAAIGTALIWLALFAGGAMAEGGGTPAWTKNGVTLYEGPGTEYDVVGDLDGDIAIYVERCMPIWCRVRADGERGWMYRRAVSFGQTSRGPFQGPKFNWGSGGPGTVCLYTGANFSGEAVCSSTSFVMRDLLLYGKDDTFSSVTVEGNASVLLCRDRFFTNYCERIDESQERLHGFLDNNVSSVHIYGTNSAPVHTYESKDPEGSALPEDDPFGLF